MDLNTLTGIAKARWWILVAAAALAVIVTGRLAEYQEDNMVTHEAFTTVRFTEDPTNRERSDFEQFMGEQHVLAEDANSDLLGETPGPFLPWELASIHLANDQNQIIFVGRGYSQEEADGVATALRDKYLSVSTVGVGQQQMSQELDDLTAQIQDLRTAIAERQATTPPTEDETIQQTNRAAIETRIGSLQAQYGALGVELMNPVLRSAGEIQAEIDRVLNELVRLNLELSQIPAPIDPATVQADEQVLLDQLRLTQLETRWTQLYTELNELESLTTVGAVAAQPPTIPQPGGRMNQLLAFVGATVVAMLALVAIERARGIVWSSSEYKDDTKVLTELPPRQLRTFRRPSSEPWYVTVPTGRRKAAVQLIRSQLDGHQNAAVAFQGTGVFDADTLDLAADVAMSTAVSGRNVLLIDGTFSGKPTPVEYGQEDAEWSVMKILEGLPDDPHTAMMEIKSTLVAIPEQQRNLRSLGSGAGSLDAGDVLASSKFEMLLEVARENYDLIVVAGAVYDHPTSHILAQRVDSIVLLGSFGHTIDRQVEAAQRDFRARRAALLGVVMLRRRRSRARRWLSPRIREGLWSFMNWLGSRGAEDGEEASSKGEAKSKGQDIGSVTSKVKELVERLTAGRQAETALGDLNGKHPGDDMADGEAADIEESLERSGASGLDDDGDASSGKAR